jgi:hypothetical protein
VSTGTENAVIIITVCVLLFVVPTLVLLSLELRRQLRVRRLERLWRDS